MAAQAWQLRLCFHTFERSEQFLQVCESPEYEYFSLPFIIFLSIYVSIYCAGDGTRCSVDTRQAFLPLPR